MLFQNSENFSFVILNPDIYHFKHREVSPAKIKFKKFFPASTGFKETMTNYSEFYY